jgi:hypothetical protein
MNVIISNNYSINIMVLRFIETTGHIGEDSLWYDRVIKTINHGMDEDVLKAHLGYCDTSRYVAIEPYGVSDEPITLQNVSTKDVLLVTPKNYKHPVSAFVGTPHMIDNHVYPVVMRGMVGMRFAIEDCKRVLVTPERFDNRAIAKMGLKDGCSVDIELVHVYHHQNGVNKPYPNADCTGHTLEPKIIDGKVVFVKPPRYDMGRRLRQTYTDKEPVNVLDTPSFNKQDMETAFNAARAYRSSKLIWDNFDEWYAHNRKQ